MFSDLIVLNEDSYSQPLHIHLTRPTAALARLFHPELNPDFFLEILRFQESQAGRLEVLVHKMVTVGSRRNGVHVGPDGPR